MERHVSYGALSVLTVDGVDLRRGFSLVTLRDRVVSPAMRAFDHFITEAWFD